MEMKEYKQAKDVKEEIKADITRHIRHCAMRHGVKQEEVVEIMRKVVEERV